MGKTKIDSKGETCISEIYKSLKTLASIDNKEIVIICIGTDRSTGDSLGPLIGTLLSKHKIAKESFHIYGTIKEPVHARNLIEALNYIENEYINPYIIAIDASLGDKEGVGKIIIRDGSIAPGAALDKELPRVGDLSIMGIVSEHGCMEFMTLQNTRLYDTYCLAEKIEEGLKIFLKEQLKESKSMEVAL